MISINTTKDKKTIYISFEIKGKETFVDEMVVMLHFLLNNDQFDELKDEVLDRLNKEDLPQKQIIVDMSSKP